MTQTILSGAAAYATPAQWSVRVDWRTAADLLSDSGSRLASQAAVEASSVLTSILRAASGEVEAVALIGGRYRPEDLSAIATASPVTNATDLLADIVVGLGVARLYRRRPDPNRATAEITKEAREWLQKLADGQAIFPTEQVAAAGRVDSITETATMIEARDGVVFQAERYFGRRADRDDPNRL